MSPYELNNDQRKYFGLSPVAAHWDKQQLSEKVTVHYDKEKIVKVLQYNWGYLEYDTNITTRSREILLPYTPRGKEQKLTVPRLLKRTGSDIQFSASFEGGGITVYSNRRKLFFIKSYPEEGAISNFAQVEAWIANYIRQSPEDYFQWLHTELAKGKQQHKSSAGDIIAFPVGRREFGFAKLLVNGITSDLSWVTGKIFDLNLLGNTLLLLPYAFLAPNTDIDLDALLLQPALPHILMFDTDVRLGEFPIIGNRPVVQSDFHSTSPLKPSKYLTIPYSKTDIQSQMK